MRFHTPVLLQEVIEVLDPKPGKSFIDATIGGGGHTFELLKYGARVLGIDRDPEAIEYVKSKWKMENVEDLIEPEGSSEPERPERSRRGNLKLVQGNFSNIGSIAKENGFDKVNGILFDLGVSSHQLEEAQRGFSFAKVGPLDMRMDKSLNVRAYDIVNHFDRRRLDEIFKTYGQQKHSWAISKAIESASQIKPIETTIELKKIIDEVLPSQGPQFAKLRIGEIAKAFQALRIVVNTEILNLQESLPQTIELLQEGGRLAIISFHSLEDRVVKRFFKRQARLKILTKKPIGPGNQEVSDNPRSRSAKLRAAEKI